MKEVKTIARWVVIAIVVILASNIAGQNNQWVSLRFWPFGEIMTLPLWAVLLGGVCLGMLLATILFGWRVLLMEVKNVQLNRRMRQMEEQTERLAEKTRLLADTTLNMAGRHKKSIELAGKQKNQGSIKDNTKDNENDKDTPNA